MKCFHHTDLDGVCSAAVVLNFLPKCKLIPVNYNYDLMSLVKTVKKDEQVYLVDFSFVPEVMDVLLSITDNIIWLDHHKTNIESYPEIQGIRDTSKAGCVLTWYWFTDGLDEIVSPPKAVELIGDADNWTWVYGEEAELFVLGLELENTQPTSKIWNTFFNHYDPNILISQIKANGSIIKKYKTINNGTIVSAWGFEGIFEGYKALFLNKAHCGSKTFKSIKNKRYDVWVAFVHDGKQWTVSLYSETVDVSFLAKKHGGGGHKGASGFQTTINPWELEHKQCI